MRFRSAASGLAFLQRCGWFSFFFHKSKRVPAFCLVAGLLPALLVPNAVAQSSASVPLFQFAIFYNVDLDISPGAAMTIGGKTFSNGNIWFDSGAQVTFNDTVACAGTFNLKPDPNGDQTANVNASPKTPIYNFTGNGGQPLSHADPMVLPIAANCVTNNYATNIEAILQPPPAAYAPGTAAAYSTNGLVYCLNSADLIISNAPGAVTSRHQYHRHLSKPEPGWWSISIGFT